MDCPWSQFKQATIQFCEAPLCEWIVHPSDAWSNLIYGLVGFIVLVLVIRQKRWDLSIFSFSAISVCMGSFLFHATNTFWGEVLDVQSMYFFSSFIIVLNINRFWRLSCEGYWWTYIALNALSLFLLLIEIQGVYWG